MDAEFVETVFLDGAQNLWTRCLLKVAFANMAFVDACLKRRESKVAARCSTTTSIFVLSSHDCFAFNNCSTVTAEDKNDSFFEEEEEEDAGAKEGEEDTANNNTDKPAENDGDADAPRQVTGRRTCLGSS